MRRHNFTLWSPQLHALREITLCVSVFDVILSATAKIALRSCSHQPKCVSTALSFFWIRSVLLIFFSV